MPTSGTHITIVQRLAAEPAYTGLLGDPDPTLPRMDPRALQMRFACLGAVGPDFFYAMADYGGDLQDLETVLVKIGGTFRCLGKLTEEVNTYVVGTANTISKGVVDSLMKTADLVSAVMSESVLALLSAGVNLWPVFEPARQKDLPRDAWYWVDYLHYIRSGRFATTLLRNAGRNPFLRAYALGYLTHYVTDIVGHPYVNQVVGAPWRLAWQRHHLVENFVDAYVWDRWHAPLPAPALSAQPLDRLVSTPNALGAGAPMTYARIHEWVDIGDPGISGLDTIIDSVCMDIRQGLFDIGTAIQLDPGPPPGANFEAWTRFMARSIRQAYAGTTIPLNLTRSFFPGSSTAARSSGFPRPGDVAAAYGVFRLLMAVGSEEQISDPMPPNIVTDITADVTTMMAAIAADLAGIPPPPAIPMGGSFSLSSLLSALASAAAWAGRVADAVFRAAADFLAGVVSVATTVVSDSIKYALWLVNKALYGIYRALRDRLMIQSYSFPYTDQLTGMLGGIDMTTLWRSLGNAAPGPIIFPHEEAAAMQVKFGSSYNPALPLTMAAELPALGIAAPYAARPGSMSTVAIPTLSPTLPDDFIDAPLGPNNLFDPKGPEVEITVATVETFTSSGKNFGGALANCRLGIDMVMNGTFATKRRLPDYNLDADRGYAWPCWDVTPPVPATGTGGSVVNPLAPPGGGGVATVHAVIPP